MQGKCLRGKSMGNKINSYFKDYENFLQETVENHSLFSVSNIFSLCEHRGLNDEYGNIVDYVWEYVKDCEKDSYYLETKDEYVIITPTIYFHEGHFISDLRVEIHLSTKYDNSGFYKSLSKYDIKQDKLTNVFIKIHQEVDEWNISVNRLEFYKTMYHELQHIYREFNVQKEIDTLEQSDKEKSNAKRDIENRAGKTYNNFMTFNDDRLKQSFIDKVIDMFYITETNEINSFMTSMFPYLQEHNEINFKNYLQYKEDIPGYDIVMALENYQKMLEGVESVNLKKGIGEVISENIYNGKYNGLSCFNLFYKRVCNSLFYAQKQFYKILSYSLEKLGRIGSNEHLSNVKTKLGKYDRNQQ